MLKDSIHLFRIITIKYIRGWFARLAVSTKKHLESGEMGAPMNRKHKVVARGTVFLLIMVVLAGCGKKQPEAETPIVVQAEQIQPGLQSASFTYAGDVRGRYESQFAFQTGGRISERFVNNGDMVKEGQALMRVDLADLNTQLARSQADLAAAQADFHLSELTYNRQKELFRQQVISKGQFDSYAAQYQVSTAKLRAAEAAYRQAGQLYGYGTLVADADGLIADIKVEAGQVVSAGQSALTLVRSSEMEIQINIPEQRVDEIRKAHKIRVGFWAMPMLEVDGVVREVAALADSSTRTYMVRIGIPQMDIVRFGMSATVKVWTGNKESHTILPVAAVYQTGNKPHVWLVENEALRLQPVELGDFMSDGVVIRSGLKPGDMVVTAGVQKLQEGKKVKIWDGAKL
jgi:RND family efflux transporter MFP subunit